MQDKQTGKQGIDGDPEKQNCNQHRTHLKPDKFQTAIRLGARKFHYCAAWKSEAVMRLDQAARCMTTWRVGGVIALGIAALHKMDRLINLANSLRNSTSSAS